MFKSFSLKENLFSYFLIFLFSSFIITSAYSQDEEGIWRNGVFYKPMPIPIDDGTQRPFTDPIELLEYDLKSQKTTTRLISSITTNSTNRQRSRNKGITLDTASINFNERIFTSLERIEDPSVYPWRVNVKLFIRTKYENRYVCSGVLIDESFVLTAAHCVYYHDEGGWVDEIKVVPGYNNGNEPYGSATAIRYHSWNGWVDNPPNNWEWDMAYIQLDKPLGATVGWHGYGYENSNTFFTQNTFHNPGYPAESPYNGQFLQYQYGEFDQVETNILRNNNPAFGGQSGSGSYYKDSNGDRFVYSVLSHSPIIGGPPTGHTRMNESRFNSISSTIDRATNTNSCNTNWNLNGIIDPKNYYATQSISSSGQVNRLSTVNFIAGNSITLNPNFYAKAGSNFSANIERVNCNNFFSNIEASIAQPTREKSSTKESKITTTKQPFLNCFPNPASHSLTLTYSLNQGEQATLFFYNLEGKILFKKDLAPALNTSVQELNFDLSEYENGFYHLELIGEQTQLNKKVIIMN